MTRLDDCCIRCTECSYVYCRDTDETCEHQYPLCSRCCQRNHLGAVA